MKRSPINTRKGKRIFIREFGRALARDLLRYVEKMPADWDGHELRELFYHMARDSRSALMTQPRSRRRRELDNLCVVNNLP